MRANELLAVLRSAADGMTPLPDLGVFTVRNTHPCRFEVELLAGDEQKRWHVVAIREDQHEVLDRLLDFHHDDEPGAYYPHEPYRELCATVGASVPEEARHAAFTFEQFQATRKWHAALPNPFYTASPAGFEYCGALHIEEVTPDWPERARAEGRYHLCIGNQEWISFNLVELERRLYEFALIEGPSP